MKYLNKALYLVLLAAFVLLALNIWDWVPAVIAFAVLAVLFVREWLGDLRPSSG